MDDDLISKKELLELTGISYGALYRWKRKGLIPESWFIRRSTYTGQETFFPREKIFERVQLILESKEELSLDDIAEVLQPIPGGVDFTPGALLSVVPESTQTFLRELGWGEGKLDIPAVVQAVCVERLLRGGKLARAEVPEVLAVMWKAPLTAGDWTLKVLRKRGVCVPVMYPEGRAPVFDDEMSAVAEFELNAISAGVLRDLPDIQE